MSKKKKKALEPYIGLEVDSIGELALLYYLEELKENGFIEDFERGKSYLLSDAVYNDFVINLKTKSKPCSQLCLHGHSYTLDFQIKWSEKARGIFFTQFGSKFNTVFVADENLITYIESKPSFYDFNNMTRLATLNIKWMYSKYHIFVNMIMNDKLFKSTFIPQKLLRNKNGSEKSYKFTIRTLEQYLNLVK